MIDLKKYSPWVFCHNIDVVQVRILNIKRYLGKYILSFFLSSFSLKNITTHLEINLILLIIFRNDQVNSIYFDFIVFEWLWIYCIAQIKTIFNSKTVFDSAVYLFLFILCFISIWSNMNSFRTIFRRSMWTSTNTNWSVQIQSPYGCLSLNELFNQNIINQHLLKRIKYYRLPCQKRFDLICFYSNVHFRRFYCRRKWSNLFFFCIVSKEYFKRKRKIKEV
jgi:hypothetical protein